MTIPMEAAAALQTLEAQFIKAAALIGDETNRSPERGRGKPDPAATGSEEPSPGDVEARGGRIR